LIEAASRRQKWIDQAQSLNIYMSGVSGRKLMRLTSSPGCRFENHVLPAHVGCDLGRKIHFARRLVECGIQWWRAGELSAAPAVEEAKFCSIDNPECEACQ